MRRLVAGGLVRGFAVAAIAAALAGSAFAADLPSRRPAPVFAPVAPPPVFTWTGLYVGGQVGYEFGRDGARAAIAGTRIGLASTSRSENGVIGGAHVGYNYQTRSLPFLGNALAASAVFGVEGDVDGSSAKATYALGGLNASNNQAIQGSVRGRLGFAVDRALFYATGGVAFGGLHNDYVNTFNGFGDSLNKTRVGYTVGGGVEYAITGNWSVRAEYRHTDFGKYSDNLANATGGGVNVRHRDTDNRVQAGFSYKFDLFGAPAPVVARY